MCEFSSAHFSKQLAPGVHKPVHGASAMQLRQAAIYFCPANVAPALQLHMTHPLLMSAPFASSSSVTSWLGLLAAMCRAVRPVVLTAASTSASCCSRTSRVGMSRFLVAVCRGVYRQGAYGNQNSNVIQHASGQMLKHK